MRRLLSLFLVLFLAFLIPILCSQNPVNEAYIQKSKNLKAFLENICTTLNALLPSEKKITVPDFPIIEKGIAECELITRVSNFLVALGKMHQPISRSILNLQDDIFSNCPTKAGKLSQISRILHLFFQLNAFDIEWISTIEGLFNSYQKNTADYTTVLGDLKDLQINFLQKEKSLSSLKNTYEDLLNEKESEKKAHSQLQLECDQLKARLSECDLQMSTIKQLAKDYEKKANDLLQELDKQKGQCQELSMQKSASLLPQMPFFLSNIGMSNQYTKKVDSGSNRYESESKDITKLRTGVNAIVKKKHFDNLPKIPLEQLSQIQLEDVCTSLIEYTIELISSDKPDQGELKSILKFAFMKPSISFILFSKHFLFFLENYKTFNIVALWMVSPDIVAETRLSIVKTFVQILPEFINKNAPLCVELVMLFSETAEISSLRSLFDILCPMWLQNIYVVDKFLKPLFKTPSSQLEALRETFSKLLVQSLIIPESIFPDNMKFLRLSVVNSCAKVYHIAAGFPYFQNFVIECFTVDENQVFSDAARSIYILYSQKSEILEKLRISNKAVMLYSSDQLNSISKTNTFPKDFIFSLAALAESNSLEAMRFLLNTFDFNKNSLLINQLLKYSKEDTLSTLIKEIMIEYVPKSFAVYSQHFITYLISKPFNDNRRIVLQRVFFYLFQSGQNTHLLTMNINAPVDQFLFIILSKNPSAIKEFVAFTFNIREAVSAWIHFHMPNISGEYLSQL